MNNSESVFPVKKNRYYVPQAQSQQQQPPPPPPPHHNQNDIQNLQDNKDILGQQIPKSEYHDPEVEETIKRLTAQTQDTRKFPEKLQHETDDDYQKRILQITANVIKQQPPLNISDTFELSIEECDVNVNHLLFQQPTGSVSSIGSVSPAEGSTVGAGGATVTKKQRHIYESPEARARRLARNAERMRERRSNESEDEYRLRLAKMAAASRMRRQNESDLERTMRHVRDAARQRLRRAMESSDQRSIRLAKLAARAKYMRQNETPEQRAERLRKLAQHHRERYNRQKEAQKNGEPLKDSRKTAASSGTFISSPAKLQSGQSAFPGAQPPSSSSSGASYGGSEPPAAHQFHEFDQNYPPYHLFRTNTFPELPPHLNPQSRAATAAANDTTSSTGNAVYSPPTGHLTNLQDLSQHLVNQYQHAKIVQQTAVTQPSTQYTSSPIQVPTPQHIYRPSTATTVTQTAYTMPNQSQSQQQQQQSTGQTTPFVRGRPVKIFPSNDYRNISPSLKDEADRQHTLNEMLEVHINNMLTSPKQSRGRPYKGRETDDNRYERLRKMADSRRAQRDKETPDQRAERLRDLAERARKRREITMQTETDDERRLRLHKQAEYARMRRQRAQTPQALRMAEQRAKHLYTKIHEKPTTTISLSQPTTTGKGKSWTNYGNRK